HGWGTGGPGNGVNADNFSARWTGTFNFPGGQTTFTATNDDGMRVWVDGNLIIDDWFGHPPETHQASPSLTAGSHVVTVEDFELAGGAVAQVSWPQQTGVLQVSAPTYTVAETGGSATITVTRIGGSAGAVGVTFATSNGTATAGFDHTAVWPH